MLSSLEKIKQLVKEKIGLDSQTIGSNTVEKILQRRMMQCDIEDMDDYFLLVSSSSDELNELLEVAVIPETWFFRDIRPFEKIYKNIQKNLLQNKTCKFNILSLPSSTGEEPYSLAMYLIEHGIPEENFSIEAVDVSNRALKFAQMGIYTNNSFRGKDYPSYQSKYFCRLDKYYKINKNIQKKIKFYPLNILQDNTDKHKKFDFILCRNLLIYFDGKTKKIAFNNLSHFLKDSGLLFVGHSEFGSVPEELFQNTGFEQAFALIMPSNPLYRKKPEPNTEFKSSPAKAFVLNKPAKLEKACFSALIHNSANMQASSKALSSDELLKKAKFLADSSEFSQAQALCHKHIKHYGENTQSLLLLGIIASCRNQLESSEKLFRKSLYLNPKNYQALIHLALLLEKKGDTKNAALFKKRADRVANNNSRACP